MGKIRFERFREVSPEAIQHCYLGMAAQDRPPSSVWVNRADGWVVMAWVGVSATPGCIGTPWEGTARIAVRHTKAKSLNEYNSSKFDAPITWDDLQAIKEKFFPGRIAIEIYPPQAKVVDVVAMRWLWVLPAGAVLPFNLQATSFNRLES